MPWLQPLTLTLVGEQPFRKVDPLFQLAHPLLQLIEFAKADLNIFQRVCVPGRIRHPGLEFGPRGFRVQQSEDRYSGNYKQDAHPAPMAHCGMPIMLRLPHFRRLALW
jgi:hypothetical protein